MEDNNLTQGTVEWYIKPTSDAISYFQGLSAELFANGNNIIVNQGYLTLSSIDAKGQALNIIIPMVDASAGRKEWDEAIANGTNLSTVY